MTHRRIVFAPDGFKDSISAAAAASELASGWQTVHPEDRCLLRPMADGGEGTLAAFATAAREARRMPVRVAGPRGDAVDAHWLLLPDGTGVVELASTSGIELLRGALRPLDASTLGFGQAIVAALEHGVDRLILGIGSSASTDGGVGMLTALGARALDSRGRPIAAGARGLSELASLDLSQLMPKPSDGVVALSDVLNPLTGPNGAAVVFGPQKGLSPRAAEVADTGLRRLTRLLGGDASTPGAGAAGGTGFALLSWGARLLSGSGEVGRLVGLTQVVSTASLVITGEGSFDRQTTHGKTPTYVSEVADAAGVPVALVAGRIAADADTSAYATTVSLTQLAGSSEAAVNEPRRWLRAAGKALAIRL